jgi:hypothetical protein
MNTKVKRKWLDALRSGSYRQTRGKLKGKVGFCCLGVLCDLYLNSKDAKKRGLEWTEDNLFDCHDGYPEEASLPNCVRDWAGLKNSDPVVGTHKGKYGYDEDLTLSHLNDTSKYNFKKIADVIEQKL